MVGLILAAGYATRLYPITLTKSKCLLEVGGKPMIDYVIEKLLPLKEISKIYIVVNQKFYADFENWLNTIKNIPCGKAIELVNDGSTDDSNKLGAIGDIQYVIDHKNISDGMIIVAGDNLLTEPINELVRQAQTKNTPILGIYELGSLKDVHKYSSVVVDADGKLLEFTEKPTNPSSSRIGIALYYYPTHILPMFKQYLDEKQNKDQPGRFIQWLYKKTPVYTYEIHGKWFDIGDTTVLSEVENYLLSKTQA
ncbi:MAG: nucleotidyltransferase family protein [Verrucomicrobiae bacterium]|nr:nucleotidyltransferase family protein [Verrucomicrobiae bacterium]